MPLFRFGQTWSPLRDLEQEVDGLLRSVNLTFHNLRVGRQYPPVNLYELADEYILTAELPGMKAEELELAVASGVLTLAGRRDAAADVPEHCFRRSERFRGVWQRAFSLPDRVQEDALTASFTDGVLKVRLPKGQALPPRHIPISGDHGES